MFHCQRDSFAKEVNILVSGRNIAQFVLTVGDGGGQLQALHKEAGVKWEEAAGCWLRVGLQGYSSIS